MVRWRAVPQSTVALIDREGFDRESARLKMRRSWGEWLGRFSWHHFGTLTFSNEVSIENALRQFRRWIRRLELRTQNAVPWFMVVERGSAGLVHVHALTWGTASIGAAAVDGAWRGGRSEVSTYDPRKGAAYYVSKQIGDDVVEYDVSRTMPPTISVPPPGVEL